MEMPCSGRVMCRGDLLLAGGWSRAGRRHPGPRSWVEALGAGAVDQEPLPDRTPTLMAVNSPFRLTSRQGAHGAEELDASRRSSPVPAQPSWPLELRSQARTRGRGLALVCGGSTMSQPTVPRVCGAGFQAVCGAHIPQRLSLSPGCSPAPMLSVMSRAGHCSEGARISSGNSESPGLPQGSGHTCAYCPPKPCPVRGDTGPFSF